MEHVTDRGLGVLRQQHRQTVDRTQIAVDAGHRLRVDLQVQVGAAVVDEVAEGCVEIQGH